MPQFQQTLTPQAAETAAKSPIHQLFYHRLVGGRLNRFYAPHVPIILPHGAFTMADVRSVNWCINGQEYGETLESIIQRSIEILKPEQASVSIVGHGDAHNGNVFFQQEAKPPSLLYFDPAFAGQHHPLLDLTKPLFHNVFAMWMYYPQEKTESTTISIEAKNNTWHVEYDYALPPIRYMFFESKVDRVLIPLLKYLKNKNQLRDDWHTYLKASLFCCPFLTMNLTDSEKFTPQISLLGLAMSVEMGSESTGQKSLIDRTLDKVEAELV